MIKLTLHTDSYDWEFVPEAGRSFTDKGTTACHDAPRLPALIDVPVPPVTSSNQPPLQPPA